MSTNNALQVFRNDPDYAVRLKYVVEEVQKSKTRLDSAAAEYIQKYEDEVNQGTEKMKLLLEEGKRKGLTSEQFISTIPSFCPTVRTPILNMLYFLMRENPNVNDNITFNRPTSNNTSNNKAYEELLNEQNQLYGHMQHDSKNDFGTQETESVDSYIYGNLTTELFSKIKKLKALSHSSNKAEAFAAYTKCMEMCKKFSLNFDLIPCNIK